MSIKEFFKKIRELWANKKTRAFVWMGIYALFLLFVIVFVQQNAQIPVSTVPPKPTEPVKFESLQTLQNYEFSYDFQAQNESFIITGKVYQGDTLYERGEERYLKHNGKYYQERENIFYLTNGLSFDTLLTPEKIVDILKKATLVSRSEEYTTGLITERYQVPMKEIPGIDLTIYSGEDLAMIEVSEKEKMIDQVVFLIDDAVDENHRSKLLITYSNRDKVEKFEVIIDGE